MSTGYNEAELENIVDRYNKGCVDGDGALFALRVEVEDVKSLYHSLKGLWDSLVYSPKDMSVYVRSRYGDVIVDVALCTQDFTHRSNIALDDIDGVRQYLSTDKTIGTPKDLSLLLEILVNHSLHPIVQRFASRRVLHRVVKHENAPLTVELARYPISSDERLDMDWMTDGMDWKSEFGKDIRLDAEFEDSFQYERCKLPGEILHAWLICMAVYEKDITTNDEDNLHRVRRMYLNCRNVYCNPNSKRVDYNINMENMLRSRSNLYQDGRWTWPVVLGLCTAKNIKTGIDPENIDVKEERFRQVGKYKGYYGRKHCLAITINLLLVGALAAVVTLAINRDLLPPSVTAFSLFIITLVIGIVNYKLFGDHLPHAMVQRLDTRPPDLEEATKVLLEEKELELATKVLLSDSSCRHFNGKNLGFSGIPMKDYKGSKSFDYRFTYDELCKIGFRRRCDAWGREYLLVPKTNTIVRLDNVTDLTETDHFSIEENPPRLLFDKNWESSYYPG